jgi:protein-disulfide isomerase
MRPTSGAAMSSNKQIQNVKNEGGFNRGALILVAAGLLVFALVAATVMYKGEEAQPVPDMLAERAAALASEHSPSVGDPAAKVHIVEFLDPACETCALFYPMVKGWLAEVPEEIRLSVRHVAFHAGSDFVVKVLEASRAQDKYWQTLEALLASQNQWTQNHTVQPDKVWPAIAGVGLDIEKLKAEMNTVDVLQRIEKDKQDSIYLKVSAPPEYFVNGRPLPSFGQQQLATLVREELSRQGVDP